MKPAIHFDQVRKRFGSEVALDGVSFDVPPGVVFALLGENGAGKSTAIRIMLGLAEADHGRSAVLGLPSRLEGERIRRRVGYVPEHPALYDWMDTGQIGWFAAGFYPDGFLTRYAELARQFGLPMTRKIKAMSKGMRAKVSLSLAMAHDPELLILDEPTSGLDALVRREFLESMVDRAALGKTVFLSSHQIVEVERVADVVAILHKGKLLTVERLDQLKGRIRELTVTLDDGSDPNALPALARLNGQILSRRVKGRQWQALVEDMPDGFDSSLREHAEIHSVEVRSPSLEEIFVAYMERGCAPKSGSAGKEVAP
jgi:ABC-2 type transport system ATP-binding protein